MVDRHFEIEEAFHEGDNKEGKKERKILSKTDRSKQKKSDREKEKQVAPKKEGLLRGRVLAMLSEGILVDVGGDLYTCTLRGALKKKKSRQKNLIAVGDFVLITPSDQEMGSIDFVDVRHSILSRREQGAQGREQLIAVNVDQVLITTSMVIPPFKPPLIDRYILAAYKGNMQPVLVINKIDLLPGHPEEQALFEEALAIYRSLPIPVFPVSVQTGEGIEALFEAMRGKASVFSGQSGTGKSSLINKVFGLGLKTGAVIEKTRKGSHTTTAAHLIPIEGGGFCIDTPGIKSFGITELTPSEVQAYFSEISRVSSQCRFPNCSHIHEPGCALPAAIESGEISRLRFDSYSALISSLKEDKRKR